ncbi:hypothetical protein GC105_09895 [Alkalibaculum sp. M08DMB]|uniref:Uncharacterized protein n=1 Tax=Alkalibaculum sporogenes TaxID=2655001 RepID=A0A6A7KAN7_9FIRM|nr:hypothetical protein [Alkalibaculum sporogenes]MPW26103.1 hypothetical protein [Alkalibaculum sporogenes]
MKDFMILRLLDKFQKIFLAIEVDYPIMRRILQVKLTMDTRRVSTFMSQSNTKKENNEKNYFISSLWLYILIGLFLIPLLFISEDYIFAMSTIFGIFMFMIMTSLISDFSSVLLDVKDKNIMMTRPVNSRTMNTAKAIHIFLYLFYLSISLAGGVLITSLIRFGVLFFLLFLVEIVLMNFLIITLTAMLYTIILKYFDGEKLKDVINYVQIGLSLVITVGFQLVARLFNFVDLSIVFVPRWWQFLIPPVWFGGPFQLLLRGDLNISYIIFSLLTLMIPILAIITYIRLMPSFEKNLLKLNENSEKKTKPKKNPNIISRIVCTSREELIFYRFASSMLKKEREFKLKVYPSLGFAFIFPYIFLMNQLQMQSIQELPSGNGFLNLYFSAIIIPSILIMIKYSGNYRGAWIYKALPIDNVKPIFTGTIKAFVIHLVLPVLSINSIIFILIFGVRIIPHLLAIYLNFVLLTLITFFMLDKNLPFSMSFNDINKESGKTIFLMIVGGIMALVHYLSTLIPFGLLVYIIILFIINIITWKKTFNLSWEQIQWN